MVLLLFFRDVYTMHHRDVCVIIIIDHFYILPLLYIAFVFLFLFPEMFTPCITGMCVLLLSLITFIYYRYSRLSSRPAAFMNWTHCLFGHQHWPPLPFVQTEICTKGPCSTGKPGNKLYGITSSSLLVIDLRTGRIIFEVLVLLSRNVKFKWVHLFRYMCIWLYEGT